MLFMLNFDSEPLNVKTGTNIPETYNNVSEVKKTVLSMKRTSYKVNEIPYNPTNKISWKNTSIKNDNNVPEIVALHPIRAKLLGIKLGDTLGFIMPNDKTIYRIYGDNMKAGGKWDTINWDRVDFLINRKETYISHDVKMFIL